MRKRFTLELELGNDAMKSAADIAEALLKTAAHVVEVIGDKDPKPAHSRSIHDVNGNTVGAWNIEIDWSQR